MKISGAGFLRALEESDVTAAAAAPQEKSFSASHLPEAADDSNGQLAAGAYYALTGCHPADAAIDNDDSFDRHVFASILAVAVTEGQAVADLVGLAAHDLAALTARWFPARRSMGIWCESAGNADDEEVGMIRDLLLANRSTKGDTGRWLAAMIARRAVEPNHLWEDLGLRNRTELTRMLERHFFPLASRNTRNMRWKRLFYRTLCEDDGLVMCTTPVCTQCSDFDLCFGDESGESRLALQRRLFDLTNAALSVCGSTPPVSSR